MGDPSSGDSLMEGEVCPSPSPVWCMDVQNRVVALGCKDGKVEVSMSMINNFFCFCFSWYVICNRDNLDVVLMAYRYAFSILLEK